ncbi:hypothetical protein B566_EDAN010425 [Ephemera danica]|nr:hypothetical protein B566_EDAN010425 [Ephemera danica]
MWYTWLFFSFLALYKCPVYTQTPVQVLTWVTVSHSYKSYTGYKVWCTEPLSSEGRDAIRSLGKQFKLNTWDLFFDVGSRVRYMVEPRYQQEVQLELTRDGVSSEIIIEDLETYLKVERDQLDEWKSQNLAGNVTFERYMQLSEIDAYLDTIVQTNPEMASIEDIGHSLQGRVMRVLKISKGDNNPRPAVFMDAAIHAQEWLAPPVVLYVVQQLTTTETSMLDLADWYILPVANPDGYVYTWNEERFWRKNMRHNEGSDCIGVDINRNFAVEWQASNVSDPCQSWHKGTNATSEPETEAMSNFLLKLKGRLSLYMAVHSFSTVTAAEEAVAAVENVRGTNYTHGSIISLLYPTYGSSQDFAFEVVGAPFSYTWELPKGGDRGFDSPASEILPVVQETWEGIKALARFATRQQQSEPNQPDLLIERERDELIETRGLGRSKLKNGNVTFDAYMDLDEIDAYLDTVVHKYPELASLEVIGHSLEGRALRVLKVSKNNIRTRPAVFMDAGIHAREWLAPPVALYVVQQLTTLETSMLDLADWYILPVANPDGYLLLYPYGHNNNSVSNFVSYAAEKTIAALERVRGTKYKAGSLANLLYVAHGSSQDFAYEMVGALYSYTWELPAGGDRGFNPPASEILPVIEAYLDSVVTDYPNQASLEVIGHSYEGRPIKVIKISHGGSDSSRPEVFIDAGIHAAEWLGHATALYAVDQLTSLAKGNQDMLQMDWYILPVLNPDGYVHSWTNYRKWRKTRKPNEGSECIGVDLNRNFDIHWGGGNVTDPCAYNYPGTHAYSESEAKAMADFLHAKAGNIMLYMGLHTYGPALLYPYGYTNETSPSEELVAAGEEAVAAVKTIRGTEYKSGTIPELFPFAFGSTIDFAYEVLGIPLTYVWELTPGPSDNLLVPPPEEILPTAREAWAGFRVLVHHARTYWRTNHGKMRLTGIFAVLLCVAFTSARFSYEGYQVLRTAPLSKFDVPRVAPLMHRAGFDFWSEPREGSPVEVMASPELLPELWKSLDVVAEERAAIEAVRNMNRNVTFETYMSYDEERFWRKTRSPNVNSTCIGTDPNRNFDFHWGEEGNNDPCSETWPNLAPWTEPEVVAMRNMIEGNPNIVMYMALHSYGTAAAAVETVRGTQYEVGSVAVILYYSFGACRDWAYGAAMLPLSYTWELPGGGLGGFNPPEREILPVVTETWEGIKVQATYAANAVRPRP